MHHHSISRRTSPCNSNKLQLIGHEQTCRRYVHVPSAVACARTKHAPPPTRRHRSCARWRDYPTAASCVPGCQPMRAASPRAPRITHPPSVFGGLTVWSGVSCWANLKAGTNSNRNTSALGSATCHRMPASDGRELVSLLHVACTQPSPVASNSNLPAVVQVPCKPQTHARHLCRTEPYM